MIKISIMLLHPIKTINRIYTKFYIIPRYKKIQIQTHREFIANIFNDCIQDYQSITDEVLKNQKFNESIKNKYLSADLIYYPQDRLSWPVTLYYIIRKRKPEILVETGVFYGIATSYILAALNVNNYGKLYSIDLPAYFNSRGYKSKNPYLKESDLLVKLPRGKEPGFIIPSYLTDRWEIVLGKSQEVLPKLLENISTINIFLHDSDHSYVNMMFEFKLAYKFLRKGGLIFADNIDWNKAFYDFCNDFGCSWYTYLAYFESVKQKFKHNFGVIRK